MIEYLTKRTNFVRISGEHIRAYSNIARRTKLRSLASAVVEKKNALLQNDAIAPVYASRKRFRHGRGQSSHITGDVVQHAFQFTELKTATVRCCLLHCSCTVLYVRYVFCTKVLSYLPSKVRRYLSTKVSCYS